jgi:hypothetical protein
MYAPAGAVSLLDVVIVLLCAGGVALTGTFLWYFYLSGRRLSTLVVLETLLGASLVFGMFALLWMDARGVLNFVTTRADEGQPGVELLYRIIPPRKEYVYAVPLIILALMAVVCWPPLQRWMFAGHTHVQRDKSEYGRPE